jgi:hypothetical protein
MTRRGAASPALRLQEASEYASERHATWTELFFDLVFVVAVAQLAAGLHDHLSPTGAVAFVGLFVPVVWTWTTYAYIGDLFDADEGLFRLVLLAAMLLVAGFAATIPAAFDGRSSGYVVAYALLRADIVALYAWAWRTDRRLRVLARKHALGLGLGLAVWLASLALDEPARYAVWALAIACDLATGVSVYGGAADVPRQRSPPSGLGSSWPSKWPSTQRPERTHASWWGWASRPTWAVCRRFRWRRRAASALVQSPLVPCWSWGRWPSAWWASTSRRRFPWRCWRAVSLRSWRPAARRGPQLATAHSATPGSS